MLAIGVLGVLTLLTLFVVLKPGAPPEQRGQLPPATNNKSGPAVTLTIDFGDSSQKRFPALRWEPGMTVLDALRAAERHPRGIHLESVGKGAMTLVTAIDGLSNQGGSADARNWIYSVNGRRANQSCAIFELQSGDRVLWAFTLYD